MLGIPIFAVNIEYSDLDKIIENGAFFNCSRLGLVY